MDSKKKNIKNKSTFGLIISIAIAEGVGALAAFFTSDSMSQYKGLQMPPFSPPAWVFPVVWSVLFLLMGISSYRIYIRGVNKPEGNRALLIYGIQLFFNFMWSIIFFVFNFRWLAFLWILALLGLIISTTIKFYKIDKLSGLLMLPYILWVSFAAVLNYFLWYLNK